MSNRKTGYLMGFASGLLTFVNIDELIPIAYEYGSEKHKHVVSNSLLIGMVAIVI